MNSKYSIDFETVTPRIAERVIRDIIHESFRAKDYKTLSNAVRNYVQATGDVRKIRLYMNEYIYGLDA
ncbi:MAG: hypothetical protein JW754_02535 [Candidatus Aenigmarchaeota archaeon]|nr:hypothetical protein [Candidatus Aenigmarchaeota archaeon]